MSESAHGSAHETAPTSAGRSAAGKKRRIAPPTTPRTAPRIAIVTGGASGIGYAIAAALVRRGDAVVVADLDGAAEAADQLTTAGPGQAHGVRLDVRDRGAVGEIVEQTQERHERLDLLFNNAGIIMPGDAEEMTHEHWDRAIDVNLRGVVHGVSAAYPLMLEQGHGHIVNTASVSGLIAGPMSAPYAASKHGVVGLSVSLRCEAASRGVRVSVVCPGSVDTPMFEHGVPSDLPTAPSLQGVDMRAMMTRNGNRLYPAERMAADVLRGVDRNQPFIVVPRQARLLWRMTRYAPRLSLRLISAMYGRERRRRRE